MTMLLSSILASLIVHGRDVGQLLWVFLGLVIIGSILLGLCRLCKAAEWVYYIIYVVGGLLLVLIAWDFFFGSGR